jgi:hypothetical protein
MRRILGVLFASGPFVAGVVAAASERRDFRLAAIAIVATIAAWLLGPRTTLSPGRTVLIFSASTVASAATAVVAGAKAPFGVIAVAVVVAAFATTGRLLLAMPRGALAPPAIAAPRPPYNR